MWTIDVAILFNRIVGNVVELIVGIIALAYVFLPAQLNANRKLTVRSNITIISFDAILRLNHRALPQYYTRTCTIRVLTLQPMQVGCGPEFMYVVLSSFMATQARATRAIPEE